MIHLFWVNCKMRRIIVIYCVKTRDEWIFFNWVEFIKQTNKGVSINYSKQIGVEQVRVVDTSFTIKTTMW